MDEELADAQEAVSGSRTISEARQFWGQIASILRSSCGGTLRPPF
jgi:hypothetical protein